MPAAPTSYQPLTFHLQQGRASITIEAATLAELLDGTRLTKKELANQWGLNPRTFETRRLAPGTTTQEELHKLAATLGVPYLDIARLIYQQCQVENEATQDAPVTAE